MQLTLPKSDSDSSDNPFLRLESQQRAVLGGTLQSQLTPPSYHPFSPSASLSSTPDTIRSGQLHGSKAACCIAGLHYGTPSETSRKTEYNTDVTCFCSPIQITKFYTSFSTASIHIEIPKSHTSNDTGFLSNFECNMPTNITRAGLVDC